MAETIEINNDTNKDVCVSAVRSKLSGRLFVKIHKFSMDGDLVKPNYYKIIDVKEVEF
jgi:hypothetical protein